MTGNEKLRPSVQLYDYLEKGIEPKSDAVKSWARLHVYRAAAWVIEGRSREERRDRLNSSPKHTQTAIENEAKKIWKRRKDA